MDYSYDSHSYKPSRAKHDSFLQPSSARDVYGYSRNSRSSTRLDVPTEHISRNKSVGERERRPYGGAEADHRSRSSVRREETYPTFSTRNKSSRRRRSWPPAPSVEDEDEAAAKEFPKRPIRKQSDDEVSMPGTVDQNPMMIELENHERRFVVVPQDGSKKAKSESRSRRRSERERPSDLKVDVDVPELFAKRQSTPYAFSKPSLSIPKQPNGHHSSSSSSDPSRAPSVASDDEYRRASRRTANSSSDERQSDGSDLEPSAVKRLRERKQKPRVSFTEPTSSPARPEIKRFSSDYTSPTESRSKAPGPSLLKKSALREGGSPRSSDDEGMGRRRETNKAPPRSTPIVPVMIPDHVRADGGLGIRPSLQELGNPDRSPESRSTYPPVSPRLGDRSSSGDYYTSTPSGGRSSRPGSPSMSSLDAPASAYDTPRSKSYSQPDHYSPGYEQLTSVSARPGGHSRHASFDRTIPSSVPPPPPPVSVLPYPVDDPMILMPNHEHYIDTPTRENPPPLPPTKKPEPRKPEYSPSNYTASPKNSPRLGVEDDFPPRPRARSNTETKRPDMAKIRADVTATAPLPPCPRMEYSRSYVDWYTLRGDNSVDICPSCYDGIVRPTPFRLEFVKAPMRAATVSTRCDFGSAWYRAAWLLTQKRSRQDLDLIYALSAIMTVADSCPGNREHAGPWYGIFGDGQPIPGFAICSRDMRFIEAIFPSLIGLFHRISPSSTGRDAKMCSMRLPGDKFGDYLNLFEKIDEEARKKPLKQSQSLQELIKYIRASNVPPPPLGPPPTPKSKKCLKDTSIIDGTWHFMPLLPEFTVCASCYDEVIWPLTKSSNASSAVREVANEFHPVLTPLPAGVRMDGASCTLYSPRMRDMFKQVSKYGEREASKLLAREVRQRREMEDRLKRKQAMIDDKLRRSRNTARPLGEDIREQCRSELEEIARVWATWE